MNFKATKTPLLIAVMAAGMTLSAFAPANAKSYWVSAPVEIEEIDSQDAQIFDAKFKVKKHHSFKHKRHHHAKVYRGHGGFKKKKHVSKHHHNKKYYKKKLYKKLF